MSAALDHEAREVLGLAAEFIMGRPIEAYVRSCVRLSEGGSRCDWQFNMQYEAELGFDPIKVTWRVMADKYESGDPPRARTKVVKVEVSRG